MQQNVFVDHGQTSISFSIKLFLHFCMCQMYSLSTLFFSCCKIIMSTNYVAIPAVSTVELWTAAVVLLVAIVAVVLGAVCVLLVAVPFQKFVLVVPGAVCVLLVAVPFQNCFNSE